MAVSYKKLFHMLIDRDMSAAQLQKEAGYSANISTRLRKDIYISLESVENFHAASGKSEPLLSWTHYRTLLQVKDEKARA